MPLRGLNHSNLFCVNKIQQT